MTNVNFKPNQRYTRKQKEANDKAWYKEQIDSLDSMAFSEDFFGGQDVKGRVPEFLRIRSNFDIYNGIINKEDFDSVCRPYGKDVGELPADFTNKDIVSGKIKSLLGMEIRRPFTWKVLAVNSEATTRKEQKQSEMIRDYVYDFITRPIREDIERQKQEEAMGRELTPEEQAQIKEQVEAELQTKIPEEVWTYMEREHQDPAEILSHQILEYLTEKQDIKNKFTSGWKNGVIAGKEIFWVGEVAGEPTLKVINPVRFNCDRSNETEFIEDGEWACYESYMLPTEIMRHFSSELTEQDIDEIYEMYSRRGDASFSKYSFGRADDTLGDGVRVVHCEWKSLKPLKFLTTQDYETGEIIEDVVDELYVLNPEAGDISMKTIWVPTKYEGYKIGLDKYVGLREVPGQYVNIDTLYDCKLSYVGAYYDYNNGKITSILDRMKYYQYIYNIIWYKLELLLGSDKGKVLVFDINKVPKQQGLTLEQWLYYLEANKFAFMDPSEEGNKNGADVTNAVKEIDLSLASDIKKYIELLDYIERRCGESVGITKQVEGQIGSNEAVRNTQQALFQSANILEPYFDIHNIVKRNVIQQLIEVAKAAYTKYQPEYLNYVLDDMSVRMLSIDYDLLENSTYSVFTSNSAKSVEALDTIKQLSHAAMQNQMIDLSDVLVIMNASSAKEAEEKLKASEEQKNKRNQEMQQQQMEAQQKEAQAQREWEEKILDKKHANTIEEIKTKGELDLQKQAMLSVGFNEDKDIDKDGVPDVLEIYKAGVDTELRTRKLDIEEARLEESKKQHEDRMKLENKKMESQIAKSKITS
jgi:hypothetical protein|uniref:Portal protein n=1 Tax=Podoviridae sp. ctQyH19 TaxID=2825249 RepID=A0A8S5UQK3_9CAUD|nr:MAG TPA: portal protein [Podoviridae sp. ctQyH19]